MHKILLVDDSTFARNNIKRILGDQYEYFDAGDGLSGLEAYFMHKPNLVILDITMPGTNGLEVLEQILMLDPGAQVIVCSADIQDYSRNRAGELGAMAFIGKPVTPENLQPVVDAILDEAPGG